MRHSKEPWARDPLYGFCMDKNCEPIELSGSEQGEDNMDRLCACVNACAGISDAALESFNDWSSAGAACAKTYLDQRNQLVATLLLVLPDMWSINEFLISNGGPNLTAAIAEVRAAIAKCELKS